MDRSEHGRRQAATRGRAGSRLVLALLAVLCAAGAWIVVRDLRADYRRLEGASATVDTPQGVVEYRRAGSGLPVLVIHGSGGGFDQGALVAEALLDERFDWVAPSRFGYLRSTFRSGATFDDQADAYVHLLDHLGLQRVSVVALSHGGPSALLFAARHPERVASLTLLSCGVASSAEPAQADASRKGDALVTVFRHDVLYWLVSHLARRGLMGLMGADDEVIAGLGPSQRALVDRVIDGMSPVAPRSAGVAFDNGAAMPNERIAKIRAPTLIVHARDDRLQLFRNAEYAAAHIPGAKLVPYERGGHLLIAVEQASVRRQVLEFIARHAAPPAQ